MAEPEREQQYTPKGLKIPVPIRGGFDVNLDKMLKASAPPVRFRKKRSADRPASPAME